MIDNIMDLSPEITKLIIDHLDGVVITDPQGRYVYVNEAWSEMMGGIKLEDIKGKFVHDIIPDTKIDFVLKSKEAVTGHVIISKGPSKTEAFSTYIPILKDGELVAGFIHVFIRGMKSAVDFSSKVNSMLNQIEYYQEELRKIRGAKYSIDNIVGNSLEIRKMKDIIINAARSSSTVLIEGETGTGKELVAHSIHDLSMRSSAPFIKVNCAAIPSNLLESEFFGYEEGAFTGAKKGGKEGRFEMAKGGSLFFDEINQMPLVLQPKLLRALQEKEIERVGGKESIPIDVRIIVASNVSLEKMVKENKFRSDLFYRLNVIKLVIPPLRKRKEDIPLIVDNLLDKLNFQLGMSVPSISDEAKMKLKEYEWPGNIRELQNVVERAMNMSWGEVLEWKHFSPYFENKKLRKNHKININNELSTNDNEFLIKDMKDRLEKETIIQALSKCNNNKTQTANMLGISRTLLYKKMEKYSIDKN
ncbi:sigma 54-interacting transcriptional regulator [Tissierella carlieri]|uniref:sigma-54 interaction domain-containing protein n=1 Tax=Tissierella carlieri TaxID=689904 RepID=UPI001C110764|nr:sigma 54-interacting transcriptional regulator [uncultured Tissierella sp.]MBU5313215.1 sigma 54-interacting transcriptional regulator [Tissierella carlieri]MDU5081316.1 sigma 54-interacting transcriptional regulator [Bacillota bacterium]